VRRGRHFILFGSNYQDVFAFLVLILVLVVPPSGLLGERVGDRGMKTPRRPLAGYSLIGLYSTGIAFALAYAGTAWVRIANFAILYILLALGLKHRRRLRRAAGSGLRRLLRGRCLHLRAARQPAFNLHLPFWVILPIGAALAAFFGLLLLGAPTLKLRGDYLAIVTLGFGEIVAHFPQQPVAGR